MRLAARLTPRSFGFRYRSKSSLALLTAFSHHGNWPLFSFSHASIAVRSVHRRIIERQELLDFSPQHQIESNIDVIAIQQVKGVYERVLRGDVRYRFMSTWRL